MANDRIEISSGIVAYIDEGGVYNCKVPWLGREIKVRLYSSNENEDDIIESIKKAFDDFWTNKDIILKKFQNDIIEKYIPYAAAHEDSVSLLLTEDDFYADYWLSEIYIGTGEFDDDMQITFCSENEENEISVHRDLETDTISEFFNGYEEIYPEDMDL